MSEKKDKEANSSKKSKLNKNRTRKFIRFSRVRELEKKIQNKQKNGIINFNLEFKFCFYCRQMDIANTYLYTLDFFHFPYSQVIWTSRGHNIHETTYNFKSIDRKTNKRETIPP